MTAPASGDSDNFISPADLVGHKCVHEFGKLYWDDTASRISSSGVPLFLDKSAADYYSEYGCVVLGHKGVEVAIECYRENILKLIEEELSYDDVALSQIIKLRHRYGQIEWGKPFNPEKVESTGTLGDSWVIEYGIFNLIHLRMNVDWGKQEIVFMGY